MMMKTLIIFVVPIVLAPGLQLSVIACLRIQIIKSIS